MFDVSAWRRNRRRDRASTKWTNFHGSITNTRLLNIQGPCTCKSYGSENQQNRNHSPSVTEILSASFHCCMDYSLFKSLCLAWTNFSNLYINYLLQWKYAYSFCSLQTLKIKFCSHKFDSQKRFNCVYIVFC